MRSSISVYVVVFCFAAGVGCAHTEETPTKESTSSSFRKDGAALEAASTAPVPSPPAAGELESFRSAYPDAARELCAWSKKYADAAQQFAQYASAHPDQTKEFVRWSLSHVEAVDAFVAIHRDWNGCPFTDPRHDAAANAFINWARKYGQAAPNVVWHPGVLQGGTGC